MWVPVTLIAGTAQTFRNALQSSLTSELGTLGATQVRFLFALPFALLFLAIAWGLTGLAPPRFSLAGWGMIAAGALAQIAATALMLMAMRLRSFAVAYAYIKTEPIIVAVMAFLLLGDPLSGPKVAAILIATAGVLLASGSLAAPGRLVSDLSPALLGVGSGALFALSAVGFRGAVLDLGTGPEMLRAATALLWSLVIQCLVLAAWMGLYDRPALAGSLRLWRPSLGAGGLGAFASLGWFLAFALTSAANVRTLALVEIILAALISRRLFRQTISRHEAAGMTLVVAGVALLLAVSG